MAKQPETVIDTAWHSARRMAGAFFVLNNLAQTLSDQGRQEEALQWIDRAIALGGRFSSAAAETRAIIVERMKVRKPGLTRQ